MRPRILFLITEDWYFWSHRLPIACAARDAGFEVFVATRVHQHGDLIEKEGFKLIFVPPEKIGDHKDFSTINVPANWEGQIIKNKKLPYFGYGTYYVKILNNPKFQPYALKLNKIASAYNCYVNNKKVYKAGKVGTTYQTMSAKLHPGVLFFNSSKDKIEIVIHVSNYHYKRGGIYSSIYFGKQNDIFKLREKNQKEVFFIFGILVMMFFYHLGLFILRTKERLQLIFSIICLIGSIRVLTSDEMPILDFFPSLDMNWFLSIDYMTIYFIIFLGGYFVYKWFPDEFNITVLYIFSFITAIFLLLTLYGG